MRWLVLLAAVLFAFAINAPALKAAPPHGGASASQSCNFSPNPPFPIITSPDGSQIATQNPGVQSCIVQDKFGVQYYFIGSGYFLNGGGPFTGLTQITIDDGGYMFTPVACASAAAAGGPTLTVYRDGGGNFAPAASATTVPSPLPFIVSGTHVDTFPGAVQSMTASSTVEVLAMTGGLPLWRGASRIPGGVTNGTIQIDAGAAIGCTSDEGSAIIPGQGPQTANFTIEGVSTSPAPGNGQIGYADGVVCILLPPALFSNFTLKNLFINDCWFGLQGDTQLGGTAATIQNVIFDHNGCDGGGSACHNMYNGFWLPGLASTSTVTGGGSYCVDDLIGPGAMYKTRWVGGTVTNYTMAEVDPYLGHASGTSAGTCHPGWVADLSCGGNYTFGGTTANTGWVAQVGTGWGAMGGFDMFRIGRDGGTTGPTIVTGSISGTTLTVTAIIQNGTGGPAINPGGDTFLSDGTTDGGTTFPGQAGNIVAGTTVVSQISGTPGGIGTYTVSASQTVGSESIYTNTNCSYAAVGSWTDATCNAVFSESSGCVDLFQRGWIINDNPTIEAFIFTIQHGFPAGRVTLKNSKIVMDLRSATGLAGTLNGPAGTFTTSTNPTSLGMQINDPVCDPVGLGGVGDFYYGLTISTITGGGPYTITLNSAVSGASSSVADTLFAGGCVFLYDTRPGATFPAPVDGGGNTWYANRPAAGLAANPALPAPM